MFVNAFQVINAIYWSLTIDQEVASCEVEASLIKSFILNLDNFKTTFNKSTIVLFHEIWSNEYNAYPGNNWEKHMPLTETWGLKVPNSR